MGVGKVTKRLGCLRMLIFPAFATTASRLSAQTDDPGSSLCQAKRHSLTPPTKDGFSHQGVAPTIFQRHLCLKSAPLGTSHFGGR